MSEHLEIDELTTHGVADALVGSRSRIFDAEAEQALLVAHWCDLHGCDDEQDKARLRPTPGGERARQFGGDGTPAAWEFCCHELAVLLQVSSHSAAAYMRSVQNLRFRHPRLWEAVVDQRTVRFWQAREIATQCQTADLTESQAKWVDEEITPYVTSLPWGRVLDLLAAKTIEADPAAAEARWDADRRALFVKAGRTNEHGLRTLIARANAGDITYLVAMVDRIAAILEQNGDTAPLGVRRSSALAILGCPAQALKLLLEAEAAGNREDDYARAGAPEDPDTDGRADWDAHADLLALLRQAGSGRLAPQATVYVHLSLASLQGAGTGVARIEDEGAASLAQVTNLLRHSHVTIKPVIDLNDHLAVDCYESESVAERVRLRSPFEVSPFGTRSSRSCDRDHSRKYVPISRGGPPGQTTAANLGPLGRTWHRVKTHGNWIHLHPREGRYYWCSPHGYWSRCDASGTHFLGQSPAEAAPIRHLCGATQTASPMEDHLRALIAA
jgi:hypothetical protein